MSSAMAFTKLSSVPESEIVWADGKKTALAENEVIISVDELDFGSAGAQMQLEQIQNGSETLTPELLRELLSKADDWEHMIDSFDDSTNTYSGDSYGTISIVGCILPGSRYSNTTVLPDAYADKVLADAEGIYDSAVGPMPESRGGVEKLVRYCYRDGRDITERYALNDPVVYELDTVNSALKVLAKVFLYIGIGFAVFASLLLANFISTSIHYKRQEIGILRAIGSRSNDVFRIFFSESFVIAMINFVLSAAGCFTLVTLINSLLRSRAGILITVLHFGFRQLLLLFVICVGAAAIASFLPVRRIAAKKPIDAIRDK